MLDNKSKNSLTTNDLQALGDLMGGLLDKQAAILATKVDLARVEARLDDMATKQDLADLKDHILEGFEAVMDGVDNLTEKLADKERLERIVEWAIIAGEKIGVKPKV